MIDRTSATWTHIDLWAEKADRQALAQIRQPGLSMEDTEFLRGRLAAFAEVRALAVEKPASLSPETIVT